MILEVLLRARKHLRGRCARSAHDLAREVPSSQPDEQRVEIVLDGLLVHLHTAAFAFASQLAVLQLLLGFRDAPLDLRLPESALRQFFFGVHTLLRFGRDHGRRKSRTAALERPSSARKGEAAWRGQSVATPTLWDLGGIYQNAASKSQDTVRQDGLGAS
jgi:hypothetical protein